MMDELRRIAEGDQQGATQRDAVNASWELGRMDGLRAAAFYRNLVANQVPVQVAMQLTGTYVATVIRDSAGQESE